MTNKKVQEQKKKNVVKQKKTNVQNVKPPVETKDSAMFTVFRTFLVLNVYASLLVLLGLALAMIYRVDFYVQNQDELSGLSGFDLSALFIFCALIFLAFLVYLVSAIVSSRRNQKGVYFFMLFALFLTFLYIIVPAIICFFILFGLAFASFQTLGAVGVAGLFFYLIASFASLALPAINLFTFLILLLPGPRRFYWGKKKKSTKLKNLK
jgi:hypothetical protein